MIKSTPDPLKYPYWHMLTALGVSEDEKFDLERLHLVLENMPDDELMQFLEKRRGRGRNDFPVRPLWNMQ
ncbi:MAG: hypothetical protein LBL49_10445 [Clostridiales Family XIII bacterium]|nr:hypothetical protein [Clostridiales Family XIII bacterium]